MYVTGFDACSCKFLICAIKFRQRFQISHAVFAALQVKKNNRNFCPCGRCSVTTRHLFGYEGAEPQPSFTIILPASPPSWLCRSDMLRGWEFKHVPSHCSCHIWNVQHGRSARWGFGSEMESYEIQAPHNVPSQMRCLCYVLSAVLFLINATSDGQINTAAKHKTKDHCGNWAWAPIPCRARNIKFHCVIHNVLSLCHFQAMFSWRKQACHAFSQAETVPKKSTTRTFQCCTHIIMRTMHLIRNSVHTHWPASNLGNMESQGWSVSYKCSKSVTLCSMKVSSVRFGIPGAEIPEGPYSETGLDKVHTKSSQKVPA